MSVPLPTPEGPVITRIGVIAAKRDELVALPVRQAADGLAGGDAAVREDAIHLHAAIFRHREQQIEDLCGEQVFGRIEQQTMDLRASGLEIALQARPPGADLIRTLQCVHPLVERALGGQAGRLGLGGRLRGGRHGRR
jgi:hypothetical protein